MRKWVYIVMFALGGALSASIGLPVLGIYSGLWGVGLLVWWLIRMTKKLPKKAFDKVNHMAQKRLEDDSTGEPYVTTHYGPKGPKGVEIGFDDEEDGQIGTGPLNPTEVTRDMFRMKTAEANAEIATAIRDIVNSNLPYHLKQSAIEQLDTSKNFSGTPKSKPRKPRLRQTGEDVVGLSSGNYSIE